MNSRAEHPSKGTIVTIFGSSRAQFGDDLYTTAFEVGRLCAERGFTLCNGGYFGTMEASARGAKSAGGKTIGVVLETDPQTNPYIDEAIIRKTLADRLLSLVEMGKAYVVLQGGLGALVELSTVWEYKAKGVIPQMPIVIVGDFWQPIYETMRKGLTADGFPELVELVTRVSTPHECVSLLADRLGKL